ncbi:MAG: efflux RND transporter periplasmic adaptor subunit [Pseudomonadota bacterium]
MKWSYLLAVAIAGGIAWWMLQGDIVVGGRADASNAVPPPAERNASSSEELFAVRVQTFAARERHTDLEIRGRTEADAKVSVRTETGARVEEVLVTEGALVNAGDVLCRLDGGARRAKVLQAKAKLAQAKLEFEANTKLSDKGFATQTKVATMKASLDAAQAEFEEAEIELDRIIITAPVSGTVQSPMVEVGEVLAQGDICATLVNVDPMLFIGQVSERDIGTLTIGDEARVETVVGDKATGRIRYIAPASDPETRTFRVEVMLANEDHRIRDGLTASARIPLPPTRAHLITPGVLVLNDAGRLGVRGINEENRVIFLPVRILADTPDQGVWLQGLPETVTIITVGQDYVVDGQEVRPVIETAEASQ